MATEEKQLVKGTPRSIEIARKGIRTSGDFANMMSALMVDLIEGRVAPQVGNGICNAGGKLLKVVEMSYKYGTESKEGEGRKIILAIGTDKD